MATMTEPITAQISVVLPRSASSPRREVFPSGIMPPASSADTKQHASAPHLIQPIIDETASEPTGAIGAGFGITPASRRALTATSAWTADMGFMELTDPSSLFRANLTSKEFALVKSGENHHKHRVPQVVNWSERVMLKAIDLSIERSREVPHVTEAENEVPIGPENEAPQDAGVIAKKLQFLFETVRKPDGRKYTYREVLDGIAAQGGPQLSIGYLSQLVNGVRRNPMLDALTAIAGFFKVPLSFFDVTTGATEADARMKLAARLQSAGVESIAQRAAGLNQGNLKALETLIDQMRTMQGLPPIESQPGGNDG